MEEGLIFLTMVASVVRPHLWNKARLPHNQGVRLQNPTKLIFGTNFAHNVNFPGKLGELTGLILGQNGGL